jgi:phage FluMu gp28-like protein
MMVKATQIGISTATAGWAIFKRCLRIPNHLVILLSRSERQSLELARKCKGLIDAFEGVKADLYEGRQFQLTEKKQHEIAFPNNSRIIALAANPDTARGYAADIVADEFAWHKDADEIFKAAYGRMTNPGYQMRVVSTPNGAQGKFHALAVEMGLDGGFRPPRQPVSLGPDKWSAHWADVHLAVEEGFPVDVAALRAGCDEDTWLQEYCCNFLANGSQWIPWELFSANIEPGLVVDDNPQGSGLYAGWDVARSRDLSVVWFDELVGDVTVTRGVLVMRNMPTPDQTEVVSRIMPRVHRLCIDRSGMGVPIFETMERAFYGKVEGINFTQQTKETMATHTKRRLEERKCRLPETVIIDGKPDDQIVWQNFRSVRKTTTALGQVRFDAAHDDRFGHADFYWAKCLAEAAAQQPKIFPGIVTPGIVEYAPTGDRECACEKCGHSWTADSPELRKACPRCGSDRWDSERLFERALRGEPLNEDQIARL